jgi:hypothetical protein
VGLTETKWNGGLRGLWGGSEKGGVQWISGCRVSVLHGEKVLEL